MISLVYSVIVICVILSVGVIPAYAENIVYSNGIPSWLEYDCSSAMPSVWNKSSPDANRPFTR